MAAINDPHIREAVTAAGDLREELGIDSLEPIGNRLLDLAEAELELQVTITPLPKGIDGIYERRPRRSLIILQGADWPTRQRHTLAHEVGHHVLGHAGKTETAESIGTERDGQTREEQQAFWFAAELLMPAEAVAEYLGSTTLTGLELLVRMGEHFAVSPVSVLNRLEGEGLIGREELSELREQVNRSEHWAIAEALGVGHGDDEISRVYEAGDWPRLPAAVSSVARSELAERVRNSITRPTVKWQDDE